jgi:hypothetical protein
MEDIFTRAKAELENELLADALVTYKAKLKSLHNATKVVDNIRRELADLELKYKLEFKNI